MRVRRSNFQNCWTIILMIIGALLWMLSCGDMATAGYADSAHGDSSDGVQRSSTSYPIGSCAHCHDTFDSDICAGVSGGPYQLFAPLDSPDFCMECHTDTGSVQVGGIPGPAANITDVFAKTYKHNVLIYSGLHRFWNASPPAEDSGGVEDRTYLSANKHVECNDCHNPHLAEDGLHNELATNAGLHLAARTNEIDSADSDYPDAGPLKGAYGAPPTSWQVWTRWAMNWNSSGANWPSTSSTATKEYEICFKCHANYNTNFSSWGGADEAAWTNLALEFNPYKQSYHPVVQALPEVDPGYSGGYYDFWEESDDYGSNRLPAPFTSVLIGDSGKATSTGSYVINDTTKSWTSNGWQNWGVRLGSISEAGGDSRYDLIGRITSNGATTLNVAWAHSQSFYSTSKTDVVYSIEYYAGFGDKSGTTVTDTTKDFTLYLPSLKGYKVVIFDAMSGGNQNFAMGTVTSNTATAFTADSWTAWQLPANDGTRSIPSGGVPGNVEVGYYFSATGQTMMCSDCHSNDTISSTAAQGPHGSSVKWMLKGRNKAWPTLSASENGTGTGTLRKIGKTASPANHRSLYDGTDNGLFCLNCHSTVSFSKDKYGLDQHLEGVGGDPGISNVHTIHSWADGPACVNCHIMVPHGGAMGRLIGLGSHEDWGDCTNMPNRYAFDNNRDNLDLTYFRKAFVFDINDSDYPSDGTAGDPAAYGQPQGSMIYKNCASGVWGGPCHAHYDADLCGW